MKLKLNASSFRHERKLSSLKFRSIINVTRELRASGVQAISGVLALTRPAVYFGARLRGLVRCAEAKEGETGWG